RNVLLTRPIWRVRSSRWGPVGGASAGRAAAGAASGAGPGVVRGGDAQANASASASAIAARLTASARPIGAGCARLPIHSPSGAMAPARGLPLELDADVVVALLDPQDGERRPVLGRHAPSGAQVEA